MSQAATEAPVRAAPAPGGGNAFTRKVGPLPVWAWVAGGLAAGVGYIWWRNRQNANTAADNTATDVAAAGDTSSGDDAGSIATLQSEIQQLQGQASTPATTPNSESPSGEKVRIITIPKAETLGAYARSNKWTPATLKAVEALNGLSSSSRLKKGQRIARPANKSGEY